MENNYTAGKALIGVVEINRLIAEINGNAEHTGVELIGVSVNLNGGSSGFHFSPGISTLADEVGTVATLSRRAGDEYPHEAGFTHENIAFFQIGKTPEEAMR